MNRAGFLCLVTAVMLAGGVRAAAPITVTQKGLQFSVEDLNVSKGQVVVFVNDDRTGSAALLISSQRLPARPTCWQSTLALKLRGPERWAADSQS
jgi:hypothetical protein